MIIWTGQGYLTFVILFACSLIANLITNAITGSGLYWDKNPWLVFFSMAFAGAIVFQIGRYLYSKGTRIVVDRATGAEMEQKPSHTFFFIKMHYFGLAMVIIGLAMGFVKYFKP